MNERKLRAENNRRAIKMVLEQFRVFYIQNKSVNKERKTRK